MLVLSQGAASDHQTLHISWRERPKSSFRLTVIPTSLPVSSRPPPLDHHTCEQTSVPRSVYSPWGEAKMLFFLEREVSREKENKCNCCLERKVNLWSNRLFPPLAATLQFMAYEPRELPLVLGPAHLHQSRGAEKLEFLFPPLGVYMICPLFLQQICYL